MSQKQKLLIISGVVPLLLVGAGTVLLWPQINRTATRLRTYLSMPVYDEPITVNGDYSNIIFLHHSTGRNLMEEGGVRPLLSDMGYQFWDHDYNHIGLTRPDGSLTNAHYRIPGMLGRGNTDVDGLARLFAQPVTDPPNNALSRLLQHEVIIIKSCFPNSAVKSTAVQQQFQDWYRQMRDTMDQHPDHIFIIMTSPPLHPLATTPEEAARARAIANWLTSGDFLAGHDNVFVFDFFDLLADPAANTLRTEYQMTITEAQSHPNQLANETIGPLFAAFIDTAIQTYRNQ
ncbi:MAG: hypothetical protein H6667_20000 [Ardenticatenaceae bacterium]|nr:hypothetical protein [Ardenticatenaceae bacterium]MCB9443932.1 hypothetical protein [Ardenticatenaceae bacterium]